MDMDQDHSKLATESKDKPHNKALQMEEQFDPMEQMVQAMQTYLNAGGGSAGDFALAQAMTLSAAGINFDVATGGEKAGMSQRECEDRWGFQDVESAGIVPKDLIEGKNQPCPDKD
jgi:hypothetical protein